MKYAAGALVCALYLTPTNAQTPGQPMVIGSMTASNVLPKGTTVRLRTMQALSSKDDVVGKRFDLETVDDVMLNSAVIIPRGSLAIGEITFAKKKGMWGKSGRLETQLISVRANGVDIPLRGGTSNQKGETGTAGVVASIAVIPLAGFFVTGTSAVLPMGSPASGITISDIPVTFAALTASPMLAKPQ